MEEFEKMNEAIENEQTEQLSELDNANTDNTENEPVTEVVQQVEEGTETVQKAADEPEETPSESDEEVQESADESEEATSESNAESESAASVEGEQLPVQNVMYVDAAPVRRKKRLLQGTIITACCIFLCAALVFGGIYLFNILSKPKIEGVWACKQTYLKSDKSQGTKLKTSGKSAVYYTFKSGGDFSLTSGTIVHNAKWSYADSKGKKTDKETNRIMLYAEGSEAEASVYKFVLEGNAFSDKKLKLEIGEDTMVQVYEFVSVPGDEAPVYKIKPDKNFKPVKELFGKWYDKASKQRLTFNKDGSYVLTVSDTLIQSGNYTVDTKAKTITLSYVSDGVEADTGGIPYTLKGDKLTLVSYEFVKEK